MKNKKQLAALLMTAVLAGPALLSPAVMADSVNGSVEEQADITNWVANTPQQISNNMAMQHINTNDLNGTKYIVQWGDTLSGISAATGISVNKIAYDNHIQNINLIYAGQTLILNRNGSVPADYHGPVGDPHQVVISKTTINNGPKNVTFKVSPKVTVNNDNSDNSTTNITDNSQTNNNENSNDSDEDTTSASSSTTTKSSTKKSHHSTTNSSAAPADSDELASDLSEAASNNGDDDITFSKYDDSDSDDLESVDLGNDAKKINKAVKKGNFSKAEKLIKDNLDDDDNDVYVDYDDGEVSVYTKKSSDRDSSSDDSDNQSSSDNDNQDSQQVDTQNETNEDDD
ncbi:LysM peptidoglycan-binding domain-containing protein [Limosilactobacillus caecicola]|uniref:LysM peptidoglycan-binding domain-containing protein n=1 Tax=Limosilactobacillus caecicola TaxID=2941332 RepID=UPI00203A99EC|nr:LysM domain-containing protein [Limosilactobacillus caecicola]